MHLTPADLDLDVGLAPGDDLGVALGRLVMEATTAPDPLARFGFEGLAAAGQLAPPLQMTSADGNQSGRESREVSAQGVSALLDLVAYAVEAGDSSALARLGALRGELTTPLGIGARLDAQQVSSAASSTSTSSEVRLTLSGLRIGLSDLLPADLLADLPLGVVLSLVNGLDLTVPADLAAEIAAVEVLVPMLQDALATAGSLADAEDDLQAVLDSDPTLAALQGAVDAAAAEAATLEAAIAALEAELATTVDPVRLLEIPGEILALEADLAQAEDDLAQAEADLAAALDAATAELVAAIEELEQLLADLLAELTDLVDGIDLVDLRLDLLDLLGDTPLLDLGAVQLHLLTRADGTASLGEATCTAGETRLLGTVVPVPTCAAVSDALDELAGVVADALGALPLSVPRPAITAAGPTLASSGAGGPDAAGTTLASVEVTPLRLTIPPVELTSMVDDLLSELDALVAGLLAEVDLAGTGLLETLLDDLDASLDLLPVGDALAGLRTAGLEATVGSINLTSTFTAQAAGGPTPADPGAPGDDSSRSLDGPDGGTELPRTGTDGALPTAGALALLLAALAVRRLLST